MQKHEISEKRNVEQEARARFFREENSPFLFAMIGLTLICVFIADFYTRLGVAVWVLYIIPLCLSLFTWKPRFPLIAALVITFCMTVNFLLDSSGINPAIAQLNRVLGVVSVWGIAAIGYFFIQNKIAVRKEEWLQSGEAQLSSVMVGEKKIEELAEAVLNYLCEYMEACAGALYITADAGYQCAASWGVAQESLPQAVNGKDGVLGQAITDQRIFVIEDIPDGYLNYASAFGKGAPRYIVIAPMVENGQVMAIVELGFDGKYDDFSKEFFQRVSLTVGVAFRSAEYRRNLQKLLKETQRQAEELQTQEEELRVSNEELEEQSNILLESQTQLEQQQAELEQTNAQLEEQTQRLEEQKDELEKTKGELQLRARELEQASQYKSDFLANMSHELRTPLNSTLILSKLLADNARENLTDEQVRFAETIHMAGNDLLNLINDILDLSKIEAGHMEIEPQDIKLPRFVDDITRTFEPIATDKGLNFVVEVDATAPEMIESDRMRLEQVLKNLLSNALKFTSKGSVRFEVRKAANNSVAFAVADTGIGIAEDKYEVIFDAFRQADGTTNRKFGGTGLGLSISRELGRLLGGRIDIQSKVGKGSTFTLTIPVTYNPEFVKPREIVALEDSGIEKEAVEEVVEVKAKETVKRKAANTKPGNVMISDDREKIAKGAEGKNVILVIEDDPAFASILYDMTSGLGFYCLVESTAEGGIAACMEYLPHAVILDLGLPDHSGLAVLDRIKQSSKTRHIPVHIISAEDHSHTARALGAIGYLIKPVQKEDVTEAIKQLEDKMVRRVKRLLIVEDNQIQRESLQKLLGSAEVEAVGVGSAQECMEKLKAETFDCMVLDLSLPDESGHSLLETLSEEEDYSFPPVIVYTGKEISSKEEQQLRRYSKSIIIKGAKSPERLLDEVTLFLHQVVSDLPKKQQSMIKKARSRDALLEGRRILVVEDDIRNVYSLSSILEPRGAVVEIARNGLEALEILEKSKSNDNDAIDLVLMDVMMPEMDGLTATRKIRQDHTLKKLPIIVLTAKAMKDDQKKCMDAGANDYMAKPLDVEKLLSLVRVWMPR